MESRCWTNYTISLIINTIKWSRVDIESRDLVLGNVLEYVLKLSRQRVPDLDLVASGGREAKQRVHVLAAQRNILVCVLEIPGIVVVELHQVLMIENQSSRQVHADEFLLLTSSKI